MAILYVLLSYSSRHTQAEIVTVWVRLTISHVLVQTYQYKCECETSTSSLT